LTFSRAFFLLDFLSCARPFACAISLCSFQGTKARHSLPVARGFPVKQHNGSELPRVSGPSKPDSSTRIRAQRQVSTWNFSPVSPWRVVSAIHATGDEFAP